MKKKITSFIIMLAVLVSMLSTTVFADTESSKTQLETIKSQMQQTADYLADYYADQIKNNVYDSSDIVDNLSACMFYINKSGIESENLSFINNEYLSAIKSMLKEQGKLVDGDGDETPVLYLYVILDILSMGADPTNINVDGTKYDIVLILNNLIKDTPYLDEFNLMNAGIYLSVFRYYKDNYDNMANELDSIIEQLLSNYIKNGLEVQTPVYESQLSSMGIDKILSSPEEYITFLNYVVLTGEDEEAYDAIVAKLNNSDLPNAGKFFHDENGILGLNETIKDCFCIGMAFGPSIEYIYSTSIDIGMVWSLSDSLNDSKAYKTSEYDNPQTIVTVKEAADSVMATLHNSINDQGTYVDDVLIMYRSHLATTSLALRATSVLNRLGDADMLYAGINLFRTDDGSYKAEIEDSTGNPDSSEIAFTGLISYYYAKSGLGDLFDLSITDTTVDPDRQLEMKEVTTHDWIAGSDFGFTVSSPANFASFWDVTVDGKSAIAGPAQVGADGASTYAAVGGGSIRVESGSTIVTLSPEYLATLAAGEHTIRIQSANGYAETTLNIVANDPVVTPQTGDGSNLGLFVTLTVCALGMTAVAVTKKVKSGKQL